MNAPETAGAVFQLPQVSVLGGFGTETGTFSTIFAGGLRFTPSFLVALQYVSKTIDMHYQLAHRLQLLKNSQQLAT